MGVETLPFAEALEWEERRLAPVLERLTRDEHYYARELSYYSYRRRGRYAQHLARWLEHFRREQLLVLMTQELDLDPVAVMERVWQFLGLEPFPEEDFPHLHVGGDQERDAHVEEQVARLRHEFAAHDEELERLLGRRLPWRNRRSRTGAALELT
jgi:hypothetical protein